MVGLAFSKLKPATEGVVVPRPPSTMQSLGGALKKIDFGGGFSGAQGIVVAKTTSSWQAEDTMRGFILGQRNCLTHGTHLQS